MYHLNNLNCHDAHVKELQPGDELHYGWAVAPDGKRYQHCWIVRSNQMIDLFGWSAHEDLGVRQRGEEGIQHS